MRESEQSDEEPSRKLLQPEPNTAGTATRQLSSHILNPPGATTEILGGMRQKTRRMRFSPTAKFAHYLIDLEPSEIVEFE